MSQLHQPGTPAWDAMVAKAKAELAETGMFNLPGFLKPAAQRAAVGELAPRFAGESFTHARKHNVYFRKEVPGLAADHPALTLFETINKTLCGDQIGGSIKALYEWPPSAAFLAATMDKPVLYTMDDPLARVNAMQYGAGEGLNWHFDRSEFTTTLLLLAPGAGGGPDHPALVGAQDAGQARTHVPVRRFGFGRPDRDGRGPASAPLAVARIRAKADRWADELGVRPGAGVTSHDGTAHTLA